MSSWAATEPPLSDVAEGAGPARQHYLPEDSLLEELELEELELVALALAELELEEGLVSFPKKSQKPSNLSYTFSVFMHSRHGLTLAALHTSVRQLPKSLVQWSEMLYQLRELRRSCDSGDGVRRSKREA